MRKVKYYLFVLIMSLSLCACGDKSQGNGDSGGQTTGDKSDFVYDIILDEDITAEELNTIIEQDTENTITALCTEWETIKSEIDTYEKYCDNVDVVETFYIKLSEENKQLCIRMREYSLAYARMILTSDKSYDDMYEELEEIYDRIYDDAGDDIYDEIYDGILDEMYDYYYDGILDDAYENVEYEEWSNARSDEYGWWSDARSETYEEYSDFRSDVYEFYSDLRGETYDEDMEGALKEIGKFEEDIRKLRE